MTSLLYRLVSPLGFLASGAVFALPFIVVPLGVIDDFGHLETARFSGVDFLHDGAATVTITETNGSGAITFYSRPYSGLHFDDGRPFLIAGVALIIIGCVVAVVKQPLVRMTAGAAAAGVAAVLTSTIVTTTRKTFQAFAIDQNARQLHTSTDRVSPPPWIASIHPGIGYWLMLILLCAVFLVNLIPIVIHRREPTPDDTEPAPRTPATA